MKITLFLEVILHYFLNLQSARNRIYVWCEIGLKNFLLLIHRHSVNSAPFVGKPVHSSLK